MIRTAQPTNSARDDVLSPVLLLRLEGLALLAGSVTAYLVLGGAWGWLFLGFLADLSFLGYRFGPRVGAVCYNLLHSSFLPAALGLAGWFLGVHALVLVALVMLAHIGLDRLSGYGLKYPDAFGHTHLNA